MKIIGMSRRKCKVGLYVSILLMLFLLGSCKGSGASTSSSGAQITNVEQVASEGEDMLKSSDTPNEGSGVQNPLGVTTKDKFNQQKAPMKKTPTGGN
jgi:hypothetical protein